MSAPITELQQRAVEYAKSGDFGPRALETNQELTRVAPANEGAWTRLGRCLLESGQFDEAAAALESALRLNPQNTIARNLHLEVARRRSGGAADVRSRPSQRAPRTRERPIGDASPRAGQAGFGRAEFAALGQLPPATALEALAPRIEALLMALNERPFAARVVDARNRAGNAGARLYRRNSIYEGAAGHLFAFHHGGRWEPQFNLGFFAAPEWGRDALRAGIGFNVRQNGRDPDRAAGQERALEHFARFQQLVSREWRQVLTAWMSAAGGFVQFGADRPATDLLPHVAVTSLIECQNPADHGWVFCGRWLFADRPDDAETLADGSRLVRWIEQTFTELLPLWMSVYRR